MIIQNYADELKKNVEQKDIDRGSEVLGIIPNEIGVYFFTKEVHKNETK